MSIVKAPIGPVTLHNGEICDLESLYSERPLALNFMRHLGCLFCREQIIQLRKEVDANIVMVSMASIEDVSAFRTKMDSPQVYISDPNKNLFDRFELLRGGAAQMFTPYVMRRAFKAIKAGVTVSKPQTDVWMLAGTFFIDQLGNITDYHYSQNVADNLTGLEILERLNKLKANV